MKKIIFTLALTFATTLLFAQKNPFEKFTDMDGVTCVYISKNMMSLPALMSLASPHSFLGLTPKYSSPESGTCRSMYLS